MFFFSGACAYLYRERLRFQMPLALACAVVLVLITLYAESWLRAATALLIPYITLAAALSCGKQRLLSLTRHGDYSYGIYLYAFPVQQCIMLLFGTSISWWEFLLYSAVLTLLLGILSWHLVEKRALGMKPKL